MHTAVETSATTPSTTPPTSPPGFTFAHVVRLCAALATAGAGFLHLDAAGDHTEHAHIAAFFVIASIGQFVVAGLLATRVIPKRAPALAVLFNGGLLLTWLASRTVGLGFVPDAGEVEAIGWKDVAASGLELAALATLGLALVMPAAAGAVEVSYRTGQRILAGMAASTLALTVPGVLVAHEHGAHSHGTGDEHAADGHEHLEGELASASVQVHTHTDDPEGEAHTHDEEGELVTNTDGTPHLHGEVIAGAPATAHGAEGHEHTSSDAAGTVVHSDAVHIHADDGNAAAGHVHADQAEAATYDPGPQAVDPLAGPGSVSTIRVGPFPLLPYVPGIDLSALESPALPLLLPGHLNLPMVGIPKPCSDCLVLGMQPDLVFADGSPANLDRGPMLHHTVLFDVGEDDPVCGRGTLLGNIGRRFFAAGNERTGFEFPDGYGMPVGDGMWAGLTELMNMSNQLQIVYLQLAVRWVPAGTEGFSDVTPVWLDIDSCGDSQFDVPAGVSEQTWDWQSNLTGRVVTVGGHVHDGGEWLAAHNATSGEHLCTSVAGYGTDPAYAGAIESMTTCIWDRLSTIRAGDTIRLTSHYNTTAPAKKVMGIMMIFVHETDALDGGAPSPYPADPPPDGDPPAGAGHNH